MFVMTANYTGGSVTVLPITADGSLGAPHALMMLPDPTGRFILTNDLALDKTFI
jgi:6-phosphogluconolactonase (cycloisomerase 2 family)